MQSFHARAPSVERWSTSPSACSPLAPTFENVPIRAVVATAIGEHATASYLDPAVWRHGDNAVVCRLALAAEVLRERAGDGLRALGVTVIHDRALHAALAPAVLNLAEAA